ncbi:transcription termination factor Rho [Mycobacterium shinjukuense]|uniref:Transcription termination factor Rho n=1 Tax=Mycobacterium shinjukuense TaxID=398694 RepID=A0A7I7MKE4_9MYCO|nr:transcription termination factor Rho [Mycobacterium shinjukuense]MCV6985239.1 transcription termination factor Rho [Mycobacterium shinjukuense]ORB69526.1 transcription termination factor Rho [Mycobacterium shinjukuense]BBX72616.1 transcription termination factor Rho [Mycobacterium shinjukuense]
MTDTDLITAGESADVDKQPGSATADTPDVQTNAPAGALSTMVLPELRALANQAGVKGTSGMRKSELIAAIQEIRGKANGASPGASAGGDVTTLTEEPPGGEGQHETPGQAPRRDRRSVPGDVGSSVREGTTTEADAAADEADGRRAGPEGAKTDERGPDTGADQEPSGDQQGLAGQQPRGDEDGEGRQGRRGRRFRDRRRRERSGDGAEAELREDDVVQPVAGILDVLDNYAFVRTSGYLAGPHDVYVSMNMVRKNGLRRGDAVTGAVRVPREGEQLNQRQKFNPLVRLDSINGGSVEDAKKRPEFGKLTPLYPNKRLRLETTPERLTTRVIDLIMPIGKGQRALIVSPPKAGKTTILKDIANAITKNNPECHLMVVLVDERPEEVTDMQRSVKGEVIASTFDRPPSDHTSVAELAIERAKRLVEQGKDVVVLLDSITRLGRAYNNASPASGRILSGGVDSTALYPPKRFLGAARNIEEGGSLTVIATAMVETGSTGDTVIFEEFKGTGNAELKLDRKIAERRVFPAVDVNPSGTRKDELLLSPDEFAIVHKLRRLLSGLDSHQAIDLLMSQLRKTKNNYEFLVQVSKTTPGSLDND